jgi:hypothetical protein
MKTKEVFDLFQWLRLIIHKRKLKGIIIKKYAMQFCIF